MKIITIRVSDEMHARLMEIAERRRWSLNVLLNWVLEQFLAQHEKANGNGGK
jgi:predicted transcriptional regulator